ncbi:phosphate/phosphite/phosphonate ABC transporter substrate-binding protein [Spirulina sp. 06S082]|uniref:phosphate/phosphite/phosphonate ABC transporter substrate-binding protein n=1 Tax=Spirulina sp. 06S082 TaxID=3110248 RepID=UPI002B1F49B2|nr:phosphate/phosphite/phosphonate ABC transporter substrate-binding protein [Spirulina sp. 06S082]
MKIQNLLIFPLLLVIACSTAKTDSNSTSSEPIASCPEKLRFAVTDIPGEERLKDEFGAFQTALGEVLGIPIELFPVSNFVAATPALMFDRVDIVLAGPSEYVLMHSKANAIPFVGITRPGYHTVILGVAGTPIKSVEDLKGKTIGIREEGSTAGHLGVLRLLKEAGFEINKDFNTKIIGDDSGLIELKEGKLDVWADASTRYQRIIGEQNLSESDFSIIAKGEQLPNDILVANPSLGPECIEEMRSRVVENERKLMDAILVSPANKKYTESKMVPAKDEDYDLIREGYKAIGEKDYL